MGSRFVQWTADEVRERMKAIGFDEVHLPRVTEAVFERETSTPGVFVRVYSSLWADGENVRSCGEDAGRVLLVYKADDRILWKAKRVHRTKGFLVNLVQRCREAWKRAAYWPDFKCPKCQGPMIARSRKGEDEPSFLGCIAWPDCKGTRNLCNGG